MHIGRQEEWMCDRDRLKSIKIHKLYFVYTDLFKIYLWIDVDRAGHVWINSQINKKLLRLKD